MKAVRTDIQVTKLVFVDAIGEIDTFVYPGK